MTSSIAHVSRRSIALGLTLAAVMATSAVADPPPARTPEDAIAAVKRAIKKRTKQCRLDWSRVDASGYAGNWTVDVTVRSSRAGKGVGRWTIGYGYPVARNKLAKAIAGGCS